MNMTRKINQLINYSLKKQYTRLCLNYSHKHWQQNQKYYREWPQDFVTMEIIIVSDNSSKVCVYIMKFMIKSNWEFSVR